MIRKTLAVLFVLILTSGLAQAFEGITEKSRDAVILLAGENEDGTNQGMGSAFFVTPEGLAITNYHVIHGVEKIRGWFYDVEDMNYYWGEVQAIDPVADLALVKVKLPDHKLPVKYLEIESNVNNIKVAEDVMAIGHMLGLDWTVTKGVINHTHRDGLVSPYVHIIQHTAHINRGNSGGPLLNSEGKVVGVNTYVLSPKGSWTGVAYATRGDDVYFSFVQMRDDAKVTRPAMRLKIGTINEWRRNAILQKYPDAKIPNTFGLIVAEVLEEDSWGIKQGVRQFDTLVGIDGFPVNNMDQLDALIAHKKPGDILTLTIIRDYHFILLEYELAEMEFNDFEKFYDERQQRMKEEFSNE